MTGKKDKSNNLGVICIVAIIIFAILGMLLLMRGKVSTSGTYPESVKSISVACANEGVNYPIFQYDNSRGKETKISVIFSDDEMETISLVHTLYYNSMNESVGSEAHNHAAMNRKYGEDGLGADAFSVTYSKSEEKMQMTIFAKKSDFSKKAAYKYFLLERELPNTPEELMEMLKKKGFSCSINE